MKPPVFDYRAPRSLDEALDILGAEGDAAKILAGGQSLGPLLNFRLASPRVLVDLNNAPELAHIAEEDGYLSIGAMTRQREVERSELVRVRCPILPEAIRWIGHVTIRNRGTVGGSIAHADPAAELPVVATALDARILVASSRRRGLLGGRERRVVAPRDFFVSSFATSLKPDEVVVAVSFPMIRERTGQAWVEFARRHGDFALVGVAAAVTLDPHGLCDSVRLAFGGVSPVPFDASATASPLIGQRPSREALARVAEAATDAVNPTADVQASSQFRRHLVRVLATRALATAVERAQGAAHAG